MSLTDAPARAHIDSFEDLIDWHCDRRLARMERAGKLDPEISEALDEVIAAAWREKGNSAFAPLGGLVREAVAGVLRRHSYEELREMKAQG